MNQIASKPTVVEFHGNTLPARALSAPHAESGATGRTRFKTCVLHIGTEKTGSTSIQRFLWLNRHYLSLLGYFVPESLAPGAAEGYLNHIFATTSSQGAPDLAGLPPFTSALLGDAPARQHREAVATSLAADIAAHAGGCEQMIISNEHLHSRLREIEDVRRLKAMLDASCDDYRVVVYLRPQHEMAASVVGTALKNGLEQVRLLPRFDTKNGFDEMLGVDRRYFDYFDLLARFAYVFGRDRIEPRLYAPQELHGGDVVDDFARTLGLDMSYLIRPDRENANISAEAQFVMLRLNAALRTAPADRAAHIRCHARDVMVNGFAGYGLLPSRGAAQAFMHQFERSNEAVRQHWFADRKRLFALDFSSYPPAEGDHDLDADLIADIVTRACSGYEDMVSALAI